MSYIVAFAAPTSRVSVCCYTVHDPGASTRGEGQASCLNCTVLCIVLVLLRLDDWSAAHLVAAYFVAIVSQTAIRSDIGQKIVFALDRGRIVHGFPISFGVYFMRRHHAEGVTKCPVQVSSSEVPSDLE